MKMVAKPKPPQPSETQITLAIMELLAMHKVFAWRANTGGAAYPDGKGGFYHVKFGFKGVSDIIGLVPGRAIREVSKGVFECHPHPYGRFFAIEVKRPGGRLTANQAAFLAAVRAHGGIAFVAESVEDVRKELGLY